MCLEVTRRHRRRRGCRATGSCLCIFLCLAVYAFLGVVKSVVVSNVEYSNNQTSTTTTTTLNPSPLEGRQLVQESAVESLFGQVAKTVVYGGATFARLNNRVLCSLLKRETDPDNQDQPVLFVFKSLRERDRAFKIYADDAITYEMLEEAGLEAAQPTVILVHGWLGGLQNEIWLSEAKNVALGQADEFRGPSSGSEQPQVDAYRPNVIVVDWSEFAQGSLYTATQNSYKVARRLGRLLERLARVGHLRPELMHCLGHSIGAHICGQAARQAFPVQPRPQFQLEPQLEPQLAGGNSGDGGSLRRQDLARRYRFGRITALDPGGFCYELGIRNETNFLGLRPSDALLVDAYYSNRTPFGNKYQVAQYNVRLDNGFFQRPCSVWRNSTLATEYFRATVRFVLGAASGHHDVITCDHYFATRFAHQRPPRECSYVAYACQSYRDFVRGRCGSCAASGGPGTATPPTCYTMDFEWQRPGGEASNAHALEHIERHSSLLMMEEQENQGEQEDTQLPGGVPYAQRRSYYTRVAPREPYCSYMYRVRVVLNRELVNVRAFRADSLQLQLSGIVTLRDASSERLTNGLVSRLHGPWQDEAHLEGGERTLTALFELARPERVRSLVVAYDSERNRRLVAPFLKPVESVHFEYLSSREARVRAKYSSSFAGDDLEIRYARPQIDSSLV